ncbi:MAG: hypothetical protein ACI9SG_000276 [Maribacter sp.]|jgi:hypothetical protein
MYFKNMQKVLIELLICMLFTNYAQIVNNLLIFKATKNSKCFNFAMHESIHGLDSRLHGDRFGN